LADSCFLADSGSSLDANINTSEFGYREAELNKVLISEGFWSGVGQEQLYVVGNVDASGLSRSTRPRACRGTIRDKVDRLGVEVQ